MTEIELGGNQYRVGKLDVFQQFHVARRIAPVLFTLGLSAADVKPDGGMIEAFGPVINVISKMSDEDSHYVLTTCLSVCSRQSGQGWAKVYQQNGGMMFKDIDLHSMLQLAVAAIREDVENFMRALSTEQSETGQV